MKLTHIVTVLIFAALAADYSHGCNLQKLTECSQKYLDIFYATKFEDIEKMDCRSDVLTYMRCIFEEGQSCGTLNKYLQYFASQGYSSLPQIEKYCAGNGLSFSKNAAEQTLPTAVVIVGLLTVLLVRTFPF